MIAVAVVVISPTNEPANKHHTAHDNLLQIATCKSWHGFLGNPTESSYFLRKFFDPLRNSWMLPKKYFDSTIPNSFYVRRKRPIKIPGLSTAHLFSGIFCSNPELTTHEGKDGKADCLYRLPPPSVWVTFGLFSEVMFLSPIPTPSPIINIAAAAAHSHRQAVLALDSRAKMVSYDV